MAHDVLVTVSLNRPDARLQFCCPDCLGCDRQETGHNIDCQNLSGCPFGKLAGPAPISASDVEDSLARSPAELPCQPARTPASERPHRALADPQPESRSLVTRIVRVRIQPPRLVPGERRRRRHQPAPGAFDDRTAAEADARDAVGRSARRTGEGAQAPSGPVKRRQGGRRPRGTTDRGAARGARARISPSSRARPGRSACCARR